MAVQLSSKGIIYCNGQHQCKIAEGYEFYVYDGDWWTPCNGGRCCLWTVPNGTHQSNLKFYQVADQVDHQVVTMITELADKAETML